MRIVISLGDVTGVGPEVTLKALAAELAESEGERYVIAGDRGTLIRQAEALGLSLFAPTPRSRTERIEIVGEAGAALTPDLPPGAPPAARAALDWLRLGATLCLDGRCDALVTAPVSKGAIIRAGRPFVGQTEFLSELSNTSRTAMMLLGDDDRGRWLRVALVTTHLPLRSVADAITRDKVLLAIELAAAACGDLGLDRGRIGVCGLNPHAGEGGELGREEIETIGPAVEAARDAGIEAFGPLPADTLFHLAYRGDYEAVVAMYHDQGLAPLKMAAFANGVNWTLGLPFVRTSPDHGTAYDLAGKGQADPSSMRAAIRLARRIVRSRRRTQGMSLAG